MLKSFELTIHHGKFILTRRDLLLTFNQKQWKKRKKCTEENVPVQIKEKNKMRCEAG